MPHGACAPVVDVSLFLSPASIQHVLVFSELADDLYFFEIFEAVVGQKLTIFRVPFVTEHLKYLAFAEWVILLRLQDIVQLLMIECKITDLHITIENFRFKRHARALRVLTFGRKAFTVNNFLRPYFLIFECF